MDEPDVSAIIKKIKEQYKSLARLLVEGEDADNAYWGELRWFKHKGSEKVVVYLLENQSDESSGGTHNDLNYIRFPKSALEELIRNALMSKPREKIISLKGNYAVGRDLAPVEYKCDMKVQIKESTIFVGGEHVEFHEHCSYGSENGSTSPKHIDSTLVQLYLVMIDNHPFFRLTTKAKL